jgi:hypothetical protein
MEPREIFLPSRSVEIKESALALLLPLFHREQEIMESM